MKRALLAATFLALPLAARAQPVSGLYVGAGAGGDFMVNEFQKNHFLSPTVATGTSRFPFNPGFAGNGSVGYGFGNGLRAELEGDYDFSTMERPSANSVFRGREKKYGGMANVLFDFDIGSPYLWPFVGIGGGYIELDRRSANGSIFGPPANYNYSVGAPAYQGIAGLSIPIPWVVGLSATIEYRFVGVADTADTLTLPSPLAGYRVQHKIRNDFNNEALIGLRYAFNVAPPAAQPAPAPLPSPVVGAPATRSYLVFFDWDRADLTDRARAIVAEAARNIARVQHTRIEVAGHADRTGTAQYNQALSLRRAQVVAAELTRLGVARGEIDIQAFGDTHPLVPTGSGVREPQNRRVEIVIQ